MGILDGLKKASLVGAFFVSACAVAHAACPLPGKLPGHPVQRVVDGDTLRLADGRRVRLIGINAPELAGRGRSAEPYAEQARRRLRELVAASDGKIGLRPGVEARDRYGRTLAHAYDAAGGNLEAALLAAGLGFQVAIAPNVELAACQRQAENQARQARRGLWRRSPVLPAERLEQSGFALVEARIRKVERNRGGLWLETDGPLVLQVAPKYLERFDDRALQRLVGQRVEARGWVVDRSRRGALAAGQARWMLPLTDRSMLDQVARP